MLPGSGVLPALPSSVSGDATNGESKPSDPLSAVSNTRKRKDGVSYSKQLSSLVAVVTKATLDEINKPPAEQAVDSTRRVLRSVVRPAIIENSPPHQQAINQVMEEREDEWEVEHIMGRRVSTERNVIEYMIHWKGFDSSWDSWVLINDLHCDQLIEDFEGKKENSEDNLMATMEASGFIAPTIDKVVRYLSTSYFLVPYGMGRINQFCVVGPSSNKIKMKCTSKHANVAHHLNHGKLVVQAILAGYFGPLPLGDLLPNLNKNKHTLSAQTTTPDYPCLSFNPVGFDFSQDLQIKLRDINWVVGDQRRQLKPEGERPTYCKCPPKESGEKCLYLPEVVCLSKKAKLYTLSGIIMVETYFWKCEKGKKKCNIHYDGGKDGIFNFTGTILVSYSIFMDFVTTLICAKAISFSGYINKINMMYSFVFNSKVDYGRKKEENKVVVDQMVSEEEEEEGEDCKFMSKGHWITCFFAWSKLINAGQNLPFECVICKKYPAWLCFDGVSLACPKKYIQWNTIDQIINVGAKQKNPADESPNNPLFKSEPGRLLLRAFVDGDLKSDEEWDTLTKGLTIASPPIAVLLLELHSKQVALFGDKSKVLSYSFVGVWKSILKVCCTKNGVAFFMHPVVVCITNYFLVHGWMSDEQKHILSLLCPVLYNLFVALHNLRQSITEAGKGVLKLLADFCRNNCSEIFSEDGTQILGIMEGLNGVVDVVSGTGVSGSVALHTEYTDKNTAMIRKEGWDESVLEGIPVLPEKPACDSGSCWQYAWPKLREMNVYKGMDVAKTSTLPKGGSEEVTVSQWADVNATIITDEDCKKTESTTYNSKDLIAGLFVGCCVHRVCYGFHLMSEPEGRKDVMKVLYERMPQTVLNHMTVLFDFACQAGVYCVRREPSMFAQTKFLIDRFHALSHKCASFWKLYSYPSFTCMESTASESLNADIQPLQSMCAYMRQSTFVNFLSLYIGVLNWLKNKKLQRTLNNNGQK